MTYILDQNAEKTLNKAHQNYVTVSTSEYGAKIFGESAIIKYFSENGFDYIIRGVEIKQKQNFRFFNLILELNFSSLYYLTLGLLNSELVKYCMGRCSPSSKPQNLLDYSNKHRFDKEMALSVTTNILNINQSQSQDRLKYTFQSQYAVLIFLETDDTWHITRNKSAKLQLTVKTGVKSNSAVITLFSNIQLDFGRQGSNEAKVKNYLKTKGIHIIHKLRSQVENVIVSVISLPKIKQTIKISSIFNSFSMIINLINLEFLYEIQVIQPEYLIVPRKFMSESYDFSEYLNSDMSKSYMTKPSYFLRFCEDIVASGQNMCDFFTRQQVQKAYLSEDENSRSTQLTDIQFYEEINAKFFKMMGNGNFVQLTSLYIKNCSITSLQHMAWINAPLLDNIIIEQRSITSITSIKKWHFPKLKQFSTNVNSLRVIEFEEFSRAHFQDLQRLDCSSKNCQQLCNPSGSQQAEEIRRYFADVRPLLKLESDVLSAFYHNISYQCATEVVRKMDKKRWKKCRPYDTDLQTEFDIKWITNFGHT